MSVDWKTCPRCLGTGNVFHGGSTVPACCDLCNGAGGLTRYIPVKDWPVIKEVSIKESEFDD